MRKQVKLQWKLHLRSEVSLEVLAEMYNPVIRGWMQYYGKFYKTELSSLASLVDSTHEFLSCKTAIAVTKAVVGGSGDISGKTVMLRLASPLDKTKQYEIRMEYVPDIYKQSAIEAKSFPFSGVYPENSELALSQAVSDYNNCAVLIFNRALDATTAVNKANYIIRGVNDGSFNVVPERVYYKEQYGMYVVKLYLSAGRVFNSSQRYKVYVFGLKDSLGTSQLPVLQGEFAGGGNSNVRPQLADAVTVSKDAVKLLFNIEIAFDLNNINTSNYVLEYVENGETLKMAPIGVTYVDAKTLVLFNVEKTKHLL